MSKKEHIRIARALAEARADHWDTLTREVIDSIARDIARALAAENAAFNPSRFMSVVQR